MGTPVDRFDECIRIEGPGLIGDGQGSDRDVGRETADEIRAGRAMTYGICQRTRGAESLALAVESEALVQADLAQAERVDPAVDDGDRDRHSEGEMLTVELGEIDASTTGGTGDHQPPDRVLSALADWVDV